MPSRRFGARHARKLLRSVTADRSSRGRGGVEPPSGGAGRAIGVESGDQLARTLPSTIHIDTDGLDPARSNMIGAAGGFPDALIAMTASFDSQNVTIRHVPSSARKRDDSINPAGSSASITSFQADRRSSSLVVSTGPSTIVTNIESSGIAV